MKSRKGRKERARSTKCQQDKLVEIMERNPELAKSSSSNPTSFWKQVALELNSMGPTVKEGASWKRTWIEKKSAVKKKLTHNKQEVSQKLGGRKSSLNKLNELEERIANITNMRAITTTSEESYPFDDNGYEMDQSVISHHTQKAEQCEHYSQPEQPEPFDEGKKTKKAAQAKLEEILRKVLKQNEETNKHLGEISASLKMLAEGILGIYQEIFSFMKKKG